MGYVNKMFSKNQAFDIPWSHNQLMEKKRNPYLANPDAGGGYCDPQEPIDKLLERAAATADQTLAHRYRAEAANRAAESWPREITSEATKPPAKSGWCCCGILVITFGSLATVGAAAIVNGGKLPF